MIIKYPHNGREAFAFDFFKVIIYFLENLEPKMTLKNTKRKIALLLRNESNYFVFGTT